MPRSAHGGRHELGQNFLNHQPTIDRIASLIAVTSGPILELGAGNGALTRVLAQLGRPLTAIDVDEHCVRRVRHHVPTARVEHADALAYPLDAPVIVGNVPFHLTTPILRRLLGSSGWCTAVLLTQWEVARKRAGVGGSTLMTAQSVPWFEFSLECRVPALHFTPRPSVDGGLLSIARRSVPMVPTRDRRAYEHFVKDVFAGSGGTMAGILPRAGAVTVHTARKAMVAACIEPQSLPRDLDATQWAALWGEMRQSAPDRRQRSAARGARRYGTTS